MTEPREPSIYTPGPYDRPPTASGPPVLPPRTSWTQPRPTVGPPVRRRSHVGLIVTLVVVGVVVLAGAAGGAWLFLRSTGQMTVNGTLTIPAEAAGAAIGDDCSGHDAYNDVQKGAEVQITDAGTATIALTALDGGHITNAGCTFGWTAKNVPTGKNFYGVAIGARPGTKIPESQMHQLIALTIG